MPGLDFPVLLAQSRSQLDQLELSLRQALLGRMAGQGRQVVDQTVLATRLVVAYFRRRGGRRLEDLLREAKVLDRMERGLVVEEGGKAGLLESFRGLRSYLEEQGMEEGEVGMALEGLVEVGLSARRLQEFHNQEKEQELTCFNEYIANRLKMKCGYNVDIHQIVSAIVDYLETNPVIPDDQKEAGGEAGARAGARTGAPSWYLCLLCREQGRHWMVSCPTAEGKFGDVDPGEFEETYLREEAARAEVAARGGEVAGVSSSLLAVARSVETRIRGATLGCGGSEVQVRLVGEVVHRLLSLARLSHFSLKQEWERGGAAAVVRSLGPRLTKFLGLLPHGVSRDTLVGWVVAYFQEFKQI